MLHGPQTSRIPFEFGTESSDSVKRGRFFFVRLCDHQVVKRTVNSGLHLPVAFVDPQPRQTLIIIIIIIIVLFYDHETPRHVVRLLVTFWVAYTHGKYSTLLLYDRDTQDMNIN